MQLKLNIEGSDPEQHLFHLRVTRLDTELALPDWTGTCEFDVSIPKTTVHEYGIRLWKALWEAKATPGLPGGTEGATLGERLQSFTDQKEAGRRINIATQDYVPSEHPVWEALGYVEPPFGDAYTVVRRVELKEASVTGLDRPPNIRNVLFATGAFKSAELDGWESKFKNAIRNPRVWVDHLRQIASFDSVREAVADRKGRPFDALVVLAHGQAIPQADDKKQWHEAHVDLSDWKEPKSEPITRLLTELADVPLKRLPKIVVLLICDVHNEALFAGGELVAPQLVAKTRINYVFAAHSKINIEDGLELTGATLGSLAQNPFDPVEAFYRQARLSESARESAWLISSLTAQAYIRQVESNINEDIPEDLEKVLKYQPFLGPGINADVLSDVRLIAEDIARKKGFPLSHSARRELPLVLSYVASVTGKDGGSKKDLGAGSAAIKMDKDFKDYQEHPDISAGIYFHLSQLPFTVFFTANRDHNLSAALMKRWRKPFIADLSACLREHGKSKDLCDAIKDATDKTPVVVHLFGHFDVARENFPADSWNAIDSSDSAILTMPHLLQDFMFFDNSSVTLITTLRKFLATHPPIVAGFSPESLETWLALQKIVTIAVASNPQVGRAIEPTTDEDLDPSIFLYLDPEDRSIESADTGSSGRDGVLNWFSKLALAASVRTNAQVHTKMSDGLISALAPLVNQMEKFPKLRNKLIKGDIRTLVQT